jgi:serine/threonine protein kinase
MEVLGTGYWRAPEILLASLDGSAVDFSEKGDVYAFGMTCFEIVTGRLPFEGELEPWRRAHKVLVIKGRRPKLPSDLDVALKNLIERCWNPIPNERPSFSEILEVLKP